MTITVEHLKFFASERMTDNADGGGQMTATAIVSGASNQIFDDLSDVDYAAGDVSIRKVYAAVTSPDTDKYLDAGVVVFQEPADANVSVLMTSTGSFYDERADIREQIESYLVRGYRYSAFLYGIQTAGARSITLFAAKTFEPPAINSTLNLVEYTNSTLATEAYSQYVRVIRVLLNEVQGFADAQGEYERRIVVLELSEALRETYHGNTMNRYDTASQVAILYQCVVAEAARYASVRPTTALAETGDLSVYVDSIYSRIVPTAQTETPILDANAASQRTVMAPAAGDTVMFTVGDTFSANFTLYVGRAIIPGSLLIAVSGGTLVDDGGQLKSGGVAIGTVSYSDGVVIFSAFSPTYAGSKTVTFRPAAALASPSHSAALPVLENTRFLTYVIHLQPIPAAGTLIVDYLSQGVWYRLTDAGNGILSGASVAYGAGTLSYDTGSCSITLGALPDIHSSILFSFGSGADTRSLTETTTAALQFSTGHTALIPGDATLSWDAITLTDQGDGTLTGTGGSATLDYGTGNLVVIPTTLPAPDTELTFASNTWPGVDIQTETFTPTADGSGVIGWTVAEVPIAGSVQVQFTARGVRPDGTVREAVITVADNGAGGWRGMAGTINYATGAMTLDADGAFPATTATEFDYATIEVPDYNTWGTLAANLTLPVIVGGRTVITGSPVAYAFKAGSTVTVTYSADAAEVPVTADWTLTALTFSLAPNTGEALAANSLRFTLGTLTYQDQGTALIYDYNPATGLGVSAGTLDAASGLLTLTDWPTVANSITITARAVRTVTAPTSRAVFRTASAPVAVGSFSFRVEGYDQAGVSSVLTGTADSQGVISGGPVAYGQTEQLSVYGVIDYPTGVVWLNFGQWVTAAGQESAPWYDADAVYSGNILAPRLVELATLRYNAVSYTTLPLDASLIGLDPVRLPSDGKVPIFRSGQLALVHHTDTFAESSLSPTQVLDCGRVRLYRVSITDANGQRLPASFYSVNRELGTVTMASDLNLTGYTGPYTIAHSIGDLTVISNADLSGRLTLTKAISHDYPADDSRVSGLLYVGTLQARYANLFAQSAWTAEWSDTRIGDAPLAQYNDTTYPLIVSNLGAYQDRMLIKFTSSTAFQVIGENLGVIGIGNTSENCAPANLLTGQPYFTLDYRGWGAGWATGNCVRFNLIGANYPVDLVRAVQPSTPTGLEDSVELLLLGNIDA